MTNEEYQDTLALDPKEAAAIIRDRFMPEIYPERVALGAADFYSFLADPTFTIPDQAKEELGEIHAQGVAERVLKDFMASIGDDIVLSNMNLPKLDWGVIGSGVRDHFLLLHVHPGYVDRRGRIRKKVPHYKIPMLLVTLKSVKERVDRAVKNLVEVMSHARWWSDMGFLKDKPRKQDWTPRED